MNYFKYLKKLLVAVPVIGGVVFFVFMQNTKQKPIRIEDRERVRPVRVIPAVKTTVVPRSTGYGYVQAEKNWEAISEVSGRIVEIHPNLRKGFFINKGERLLKIDTATYGLAEKRGQADVMNVEARLRELDQTRDNTQRLLDI